MPTGGGTSGSFGFTFASILARRVRYIGFAGCQRRGRQNLDFSDTCGYSLGKIGWAEPFFCLINIIHIDQLRTTFLSTRGLATWLRDTIIGIVPAAAIGHSEDSVIDSSVVSSTAVRVTDRR